MIITIRIAKTSKTTYKTGRLLADKEAQKMAKETNYNHISPKGYIGLDLTKTYYQYKYTLRNRHVK